MPTLPDTIKHSPLPVATRPTEEPEAMLGELAIRLRESSQMPLYRQISEQIATWIEDGRLKPGTQLPSERRLTELLQVSRRTIRAALSKLGKSRYVTATHGLGNYVLEPPRRRQLRLLGLERFGAPRTSYSLYHYDLVHQAEEAANALVHYKHAPNLEKLRAAIIKPPSGYEGILIARPSQEWVDALKQLDKERGGSFPLPVVVVNRDLSGTGLNFVSADHRRITHDATCHLIRRGHRRIGFISGKDVVDYVRISHEGYLAALREHDLPQIQEIQRGFELPIDEDITGELTAFLAESQMDGLIVAGSSFSESIEKVVQRSSLRVPDDLSVVLLSESNILKQLNLPWTAYLYPDDEMMIESLKLLSDLARGHQSGPVQKLLSYRVEVGGTVRER